MIINRLSGEAVSELKSGTIAGVYVLDGSGEVNGFEVGTYAYLLPNSNGLIRVRSDPDAREQSLSDIPFTQLPEETVKDSLLLIGQRLADLEDSRASWSDWASTSPLVLDARPEMASLNNFEANIIAHLWHLEEVNRAPHTRLTLEIEKLPVSKTRRIPAKAYEYLATHTEDWDYRTLTSVVPKRVLSTMADDLFDFYENRLATRLINELYRYLLERLNELRFLREDRQVEQEVGTSHRRDRVYSLWGEAISSEQATEKLRPTLEQIERLYQRVRTMFSGTLYEAVPRKSWQQVQPIVRHTNILAHDRHYRYVNILWKDYLSNHFRPPKTEQQALLELQSVAQAFDRYCMLLVIRSLDQLGFKSEELSSLASDSTTHLRGPIGGIRVTWNRLGTITLQFEEHYPIHIVPVVSRLARAGTQQELEARITALEQLIDDSMEQVGPLIVLYPGTMDDIKHQIQSLQIRLNSPKMFGSIFSMLPVSAYELGVVERLARAIRWVLWGTLYLSYPPRIEFPAKYWDDLSGLIRDWAQLADTRQLLIVTRSLRPDEKQALSARLRDLRGEARRKGKQGRRDVGLLETFEDQLGQLPMQFGKLLLCPIVECGGTSRELEARDDDTFECTCDTCGCRWGVRTCVECGERYPYLQNPQGKPIPYKTNWSDLTYGMDVLAVPCAMDGYICPFCGSCPNPRDREHDICAACPSYVLSAVGGT